MEKVTVFLGGTCADSTWRDELIPMLDSEKVEVFNPVVPDWTEECAQREIYHRENDDICLYVITPEGVGFYSYVEVTDDSNKRPERTVLCVLTSANGKTYDRHNEKCALKTMKLVKENGAKICENLEEVAQYLNSLEKSKIKRKKTS